MSDSKPVVVNVLNVGNSGIGTAGLIFSCLGWLTCGILSPLGALLSLFGLLCRGSKSHAIAGLIVGFPGVFFLFVSGFGIIAGFLGIAGVTTAVVADAANKAKVQQSATTSPDPVDSTIAGSTESVPEPIQPIEPIASPTKNDSPSPAPSPAAEPVVKPSPELPTIPKPELSSSSSPKPIEQQLRQWTSADGKFKTEAKLVEVKGDSIVIEKADGKIATIKATKLSKADQEFAKSFSESMNDKPNPKPAKPMGDLLELVTEFQDGSQTIKCYALARADSKEAIIERAKVLVKTLRPGKDVVYIFNVKKGIEDYVEYRQMIMAGDKLAKERGTVFLHPDYSPKLKKWMRASHFAQISYMNNGNEGSRWELIPSNKVAERKFNNRMEPIPLSDAVPQ